MSEREDDAYHVVASLRELQATGRKRVMVEGRAVVLFHVSGSVYALDHFCYRKWLWERKAGEWSLE